ncbi:hypothetical protein Pmani_007868 [Petrolisthes manimaculis]|uniref:Uncharacterized protein n=1 Tax=Petrolisthes manimaculis TaxID=1843537 RepID=A0AAE1Q9R5_9EUCA|nr:hypothetical protein Pmani_007868 [Petrolisthes manimaculis]
MSATSLAIKNAQMPMFKQAKAEGKIAFFRHTKLITREKADRQRQKSVSEEGAVGGAVAAGRDEDEPATEGMVVNTQLAGAWSPSLVRTSGSRQQSPAAPAALSVRPNPLMKTRSSTKK